MPEDYHRGSSDYPLNREGRDEVPDTAGITPEEAVIMKEEAEMGVGGQVVDEPEREISIKPIAKKGAETRHYPGVREKVKKWGKRVAAEEKYGHLSTDEGKKRIGGTEQALLERKGRWERAAHNQKKRGRGQKPEYKN